MQELNSNNKELIVKVTENNIIRHNRRNEKLQTHFLEYYKETKKISPSGGWNRWNLNRGGGTKTQVVIGTEKNVCRGLILKLLYL